MPTPVREQVLQAMAARLGAVRGVEEFDLRIAKEAADDTATALVEGEDSAQLTDYGATLITLPVTIARMKWLNTGKGDEWYADANVLLADLVVEAFGSDVTLGGLAQDIVYAGGRVDVISDGAQGLSAQIFLDITFEAVTGNPYSQEVT